jgi:hypothetical protein
MDNGIRPASNKNTDCFIDLNNNNNNKFYLRAPFIAFKVTLQGSV